MKKIITVLGARPQFIKASIVSNAIANMNTLKEKIIHTGQHYDPNMSKVFFEELGIDKPAYNLEINGGSHGAMTGRMLTEIERVLLIEKPEIVLVYGDTNSTLAGALAATKMHIPVAHVEAGLRSFNMAMPEEVNRILTDRISQWLFAPTPEAVHHLVREGVDAERIHLVGDVMYDLALHHGARVSHDNGILNSLGLNAKNYLLATVHRAENTDCPERMSTIFDALEDISKRIPVVLPLHPRTRTVLQNSGRLGEITRSIKIIEPVSYLEMVQLEKNAALIATDSGGVQKEAFFYQVPCVTFRDETEWVELIDAGWNRLAPPINTQALIWAINDAIGSRGEQLSLYGTGNAAKAIVEILNSY